MDRGHVHKAAGYLPIKLAFARIIPQTSFAANRARCQCPGNFYDKIVQVSVRLSLEKYPSFTQSGILSGSCRWNTKATFRGQGGKRNIYSVLWVFAEDDTDFISSGSINSPAQDVHDGAPLHN